MAILALLVHPGSRDCLAHQEKREPRVTLDLQEVLEKMGLRV